MKSKGLSRDDARARIQVLPAGNKLSDALLDVLRNPAADNRTRQCLQPDRNCTAWLHDFNGDGRNEALLLVTQGDHTSRWTQALLFAESEKGWGFAAQYNSNVSMQDWQQAIEAQQVKTVQPAWPELMVKEQRLRVSTSTD